MQAQILDQHGLHQIIGRTVPLGGRLADQSLGLWVPLPLGLVQAIEKDRSQVFFLGCHENAFRLGTPACPSGSLMFVAVTFLATATEMVQGDRRNLLYSVPAPGTSHG